MSPRTAMYDEATLFYGSCQCRYFDVLYTGVLRIWNALYTFKEWHSWQ